MTPRAQDPPPTVLLLGCGDLAAAICGCLRRAGRSVLDIADLGQASVTEALAGIGSLDSLVIVAAEPELGTRALAIDDAQLEASLGRFLDVFGALHLAIPRLSDGAGVVAVSSRGHLGAWGGVHEMAFAGALAGLLRSVALETMDRGVRANLIAVELPHAGPEPVPADVADLVHFLLSPAAASVNGELILANGGRSLTLREARDRRASRPSSSPV